MTEIFDYIINFGFQILYKIFKFIIKEIKEYLNIIFVTFITSTTISDWIIYITIYSYAIETLRLTLLFISLKTVCIVLPKMIKIVLELLKERKEKRAKDPNKIRKKLTLKMFIQNIKILYKYIDKKVFFPVIIALLFYESITLCEPKNNEKIHHFVIGKDGIFKEVTVEEDKIKLIKEKLIKEKEEIRDDLDYDIFTALTMFITIFSMLYVYRHFVEDWLLGPDPDLLKDGFTYNLNTKEGLHKYLENLIKKPEFRNEPYYSEYHLKWLGKEDRERRWTSPVFVSTSVRRFVHLFDPFYVDISNIMINSYEEKYIYTTKHLYRELYKDMTSKEAYFAKFKRFPYEKDWDEMDAFEQFVYKLNEVYDILEEYKPGFDRKEFQDRRLKRIRMLEETKVHYTCHDGEYVFYMRDDEGRMMKRTSDENWFHIDEITGQRIHIPYEPVQYAETGKSYVTADANATCLLMNDLISGKMMCYTVENGWHFLNERGEPNYRKHRRRVPLNTSFIDVGLHYPDDIRRHWATNPKWFFKGDHFKVRERMYRHNYKSPNFDMPYHGERTDL